MNIFEIIESGEVTGAGDRNDELKAGVEDLEAFAKVIGRSLGVANLERAVATYDSRGIGIRYASSAENFAARGVEVEGDVEPSDIVENLY